ncbi:hypothetical protein BV881_00860 [Streptomyces sp. ZL-24]|nr:hypothetical protein BV881_00860 [Streptomyces sp. ZL-24]
MTYRSAEMTDQGHEVTDPAESASAAGAYAVARARIPHTPAARTRGARRRAGWVPPSVGEHQRIRRL